MDVGIFFAGIFFAAFILFIATKVGIATIDFHSREKPGTSTGGGSYSKGPDPKKP